MDSIKNFYDNIMLQIQDTVTVLNDTSAPLSGKLSAIGTVALMGMGITFLVLLLLWLFIGILGKVVGNKQAKPKVTEMKAPVKEQTPENVSTNVQAADDDELVAVITAAIAASSNNYIHNITVKSIRRVQTVSPAWSAASITDQLNTRL